MNTLIRGAFLFLLGARTLSATALDDYVWAPDENYGWVDMGEEYSWTSSVAGRNYTAYTLNMTSQRWLTDEDFSPDSQGGSIWWHYLVVMVPENLKYTTNATMWITGGSMSSSAPHAKDEDITLSAALACNTGTVTGALFQIPNEHLTFSGDPIQKSRSEDAIIAYTWDHFLKDPSKPEWLLRFPMVKASLRAMDAITEFTKQKRPELNTQLDYYIVSGASKRGWTTWDVGAVDPKRVVGIVPVVLDAINFVEVEHHQYRSYGGWTYALVDYTDMNLTERFDSPNMPALQENVDPFFYRDRLTMPKLVVNAAMDEFQQPDDTHYWWDKMPDPKRFMLIPNAEHSLATGILEAVPGIGAFANSLLTKEPMPEFTWDISEETGAITATLNHVGKVHSATMWYANSCGQNAWDGKKRRDFRIAHLDQDCTCGPYVQGYCVNLATFWKKEELEMTMVNGKRTYVASRPAPTDGSWTAFFIDIKYHNPNGAPFNVEEVRKGMNPRDKSRQTTASKLREVFPDFGGFPQDVLGFYEFTTEVSVWPNTFPYEDCESMDCGVTLV